MVELQEGLGELESCVATAELLMADESACPAARAKARLVSARAHVARGNLSGAVQVLSDLSLANSGDLFAPACRELARVHLRRGDRAEADRAVAAGLAACAKDDPARAELLAIAATLATMAGERAQAEAKFEEALALATELGAERDEAQVLGYRAMAFERGGELATAAQTYERALVAARKAGDVG
jgi:Tfp pilus assembly protein PilF